MVFWDSTDSVLVHLQERKTTITSVWYRDKLHNRFKPVIQSTWSGWLLSKGGDLLTLMQLLTMSKSHTAWNLKTN